MNHPLARYMNARQQAWWGTLSWREQEQAIAAYRRDPLWGSVAFDWQGLTPEVRRAVLECNADLNSGVPLR